jgi:hypothetical protein
MTDLQLMQTHFIRTHYNGPFRRAILAYHADTSTEELLDRKLAQLADWRL